jgi:Tol biopolymer transport system component
MSVRQLADTGQAVDAALSPDGEFVAYVRAEAGRQSLWLRQTSEASSVQIVPAAEGARLSAPLFSPDGAFIYYLRAPARGHLATLHRVPKLGGGETKLVEGISLQDTRSNFALSPDGRQLAFMRLDAGLHRSLVVTNDDGSGERVIYRRELPEFISGAAWSPDGKTIAFVQGSFVGAKVFLAIGAGGGPVRQVSELKWKAVGGFAWTGDSSALVVAAAERGELYQLWRLPFPGGEAQRITNDVSTYTSVSLSADSSTLATVQFNVVQNIWTAPAAGAAATATPPPARLTHGAGRYDGQKGLAWAPDGRVVFHSLTGGSDAIWVMNADGTGQRQLSAGASTDMYHDVSPDGRYVVYSSERSEGADSGVWRMNLDGSGAGLLARGCGLPSVTPDSRWVFCFTSGSAEVWRVPLEGGEPARVPLPEGSGATAPVISPDGRLVAYNYRASAPGAQWVIAVFPAEGGAAPLKTFDVVGSPIRALRWTADGRAVCHIDTREGVSNVVCLPLDGSRPFPLTAFESERIEGFDLSADGRRLVLSRVSSTSGVVLVSDAK